MERFFTHRAGLLVTAWQERHAEEDFLALVRHNAAAPAGDGVVAISLEKETRGEAVLWTSSTPSPCVTGWPRSRQHPEDLAASEAVRLVAPRHVALRRKGVHRQMAPRPSQQWSLRSRSRHTTSHHEIYGSGWWSTHCCATCRDENNRKIADHLAAWLPDVFQPWLSTRTLRRWLDENNKEGRELRDACGVIIPILRREVPPFWRDRCPDFRVFDAAPSSTEWPSNMA